MRYLDTLPGDGIVRVPDVVTKEGQNYTVTSIGPSAFFKKSDLKEVILPGTIKTINSFAFNNCISLTKINLPHDITSIEDGVFSGCSSLTEISIPKGVTSIGKQTFASCSSLEKVVLPESLLTIEDSAFISCSSLREISFPNGLESIGDSAFYGCMSLTDVSIPNTVTSIGGACFYNCSNLKNVMLPDGLKTIKTNAFSECSSLTQIIIPASTNTIEQMAFYNCSKLTQIIIPASVKTIQQMAFSGCSKLNKIMIPNSISDIENSSVFSDIMRDAQILVTYQPGDDMNTINSIITDAFSNPEIHWYRENHTYDGNVQIPQDLTLQVGDNCNLMKEFGFETHLLYPGKTGIQTGNEDISLFFQMTGNTSADTYIDTQGILHIGSNEEGPLAIRTSDKTITVQVKPVPPTSGVIYYCTLTAEDLAFPDLEYGRTPQALPLQIHCTGNTGATITNIQLEGTDFILDDSKAESYVAAGQTNNTYPIAPKENLTPGVYKTKVVITYSYGKTAEADVSLTVTEPVQEAPAKLTAKSKDYRTIALSWSKAEGAEKYQVYRAASKNGTYKRISTTSKTSLNNTKLMTGKAYYYKVRAYRTVNSKKVYSPFTKVVTTKAKPSAPSFTLKAGKRAMTITWKSVSGATGYKIYRSASKNGEFRMIKNSKRKTRSYTSVRLKSKKTYYYKMRAYRIVNGQHIYSNYTGIQIRKTK